MLIKRIAFNSRLWKNHPQSWIKIGFIFDYYSSFSKKRKMYFTVLKKWLQPIIVCNLWTLLKFKMNSTNSNLISNNWKVTISFLLFLFVLIALSFPYFSTSSLALYSLLNSFTWTLCPTSCPSLVSITSFSLTTWTLCPSSCPACLSYSFTTYL